MTTAESFLAEIDAYLSNSGTSATAFGKEVVGDPSFVSDLRAGRMPGLRLVEKVQRHIAAKTVKAEQADAGASP